MAPSATFICMMYYCSVFSVLKLCIIIIIIIIICHYGRFGGDDSSSKCAFTLLFVLFYILSTVVHFRVGDNFI
jgi:hypothetical protein